MAQGKSCQGITYNEILGVKMSGNSKKTIVRSVRASQEFWERLKELARQKETDPNKLIVKVISEYCNKEINNGRKQD